MNMRNVYQVKKAVYEMKMLQPGHDWVHSVIISQVIWCVWLYEHAGTKLSLSNVRNGVPAIFTRMIRNTGMNQ